MSNILQASIFTDFLYPFLLMFFIIYALLQKSKLLGDGQTQINAFVSLVISLIFVSVVYPVMVVNNLILFMTVGVIVIFVGFILWGFINNGNINLNSKVLVGMGILVFISLIIAVFWATGSFPSVWAFVKQAYTWAFMSNGSEGFWTNFLIVAIVIVAIVAAIKSSKVSG